MEAMRVLSKPAYSLTLFILVIGTLTFFFIAIPSLILLHNDGKLVEGLGVVMSALAVVGPLAFGIYQLKVDASEAALKQSESSRESLRLQLIKNIIFINIGNEEEALKAKNISLPGDQLRVVDLSDEEIQKMISSELPDHPELVLSEARRIADHVDTCRSIAKHLVGVSEQLKFLAVEAADETLASLTIERLKRLGLEDYNARGNFYEDIYLYLRVWLKNSIEFDMPMPEDRIKQFSLDRKLYLDTVTLVRDSKIDQLGLTDERQINLVRRYLNILIDRLDA